MCLTAGAVASILAQHAAAAARQLPAALLSSIGRMVQLTNPDCCILLIQGATPGAMPGAVESFQAQQPAAATAAQPAALPQLPNIFGRKMQQVILNPLDAFGITADSTKATPSTADAARLSAALGLQVLSS